MVKYKRLLARILVVSLALGMAGCGKKDKDTDTNTEAIEEQTTEASVDVISTESDIDSVKREREDYSDVDLNSAEALAEQKRFDEYLWDTFEEEVNSDSITLNYSLAEPEAYGITPTVATYGDADMSEEAIEAEKKESEDAMEELKGFDYSLLTEDQKFTYDILYDLREIDLMSYDYVYLFEPFAYTSGLQSNLPITLAEFTFYDRDDVDTYLELLKQTPDYFNAYLDFERTKADKGFFMSEHSANEVIRQCTEYIAKPEENLLIETFEDRIRGVDGLTEDEINAYIQQNHDNVINYIIPTYQNVISTFKELRGRGENEWGLCYLDGGKEYYAYLLRSKTGTDKTPEEVIELLDDAIDDTMDQFYAIAFSNYDTISNYYDEVEAETLYEDFDEKETIQYFQEAFKERFPEIPPIDFTVTPVHESLENIVSPAFFMTPPMDKYEDNSIYINQGTESTQSLWSTLAHEGIPGHMYQFVYFLSHDPEPIRTLLNFSGYQEGWATYVEMMAFDYYKGYTDPVYAEIERLNNNLNILVSARVEIGVNYEGWDFDATKEYLDSNGFNGDGAQSIIDYVVAEPGNYQMYCTGWQEFEQLKLYAQEELEDKFDEQEFHKVILDAGPCQFYLLREKVLDYVEEVKQN